MRCRITWFTFSEGDVDEEELSLELFDLSSVCSSRNGGTFLHDAMRSVPSPRTSLNSSNKDVSEYFVTSNLQIVHAPIAPSFVPTMWSGFDSDLRNLVFTDNDPRCSRTVFANGTTSCVQSLSYVALAWCNVVRSSSASHDTESTMSLQSCRVRYDFRIARARPLLAERCHDALLPQTRASIFAFTSSVTAMIDDRWACKIVADIFYLGFDGSIISRTVPRS